MEAIDKALAAIDAHDDEEYFSYRHYAEKYNVDRRTLAQRH
jgi:hypothetical protein